DVPSLYYLFATSFRLLPLSPASTPCPYTTLFRSRTGYRVREVEVELQHRVTGTDVAGQLHRGRQWAHVARALLRRGAVPIRRRSDRKSTRLNSSHVSIAYAVFCLKK